MIDSTIALCLALAFASGALLGLCLAVVLYSAASGK